MSEMAIRTLIIQMLCHFLKWIDLVTFIVKIDSQRCTNSINFEFLKKPGIYVSINRRGGLHSN